MTSPIHSLEGRHVNLVEIVVDLIMEQKLMKIRLDAAEAEIERLQVEVERLQSPFGNP